MYCVVQIGSRMFRLECGTTRSTLSCAWPAEIDATSERTARIVRFIGYPPGWTNPAYHESRMSRVAVGGFQHETNTFAPSKADYAAFEAGGGWPGAKYGEAIFGAVEGANIPAAGAI